MMASASKKRKKKSGGKATENEGNNESRLLPFAFDSGFLSGSHPPDFDDEMDGYDDEEENEWAHLAASVRMFSGSLVRSGLAEMEMASAREAALRAEYERRRVEYEAQMADMMLRTQLQIATFISENSRRRKRKRDQFLEQGLPSSDDDETWGLLMLGLLQCNLRF
ncbi:uncharacterized protein At4g22160 [Magnolia sinica]|uniref:uncharacterized protein At4g22160 n=1 Tax=Magnolia sinica TaxID=86752 RepID=UPI00265A2453|nr:uncharacterized protein At4g22160 [Magnolia sinica]